MGRINFLFSESLQTKYLPVNKKGKVNQGYLYSINNFAAKYIIDYIETSENIIIEDRFIDNMNSSKIENTTKKAIIESRIGQGEYRKKILDLWKSRCAISGIEFTDILIASHCKPWKYSNNEERLDPSNGLLLSAIYDKLFEGSSLFHYIFYS